MQLGGELVFTVRKAAPMRLTQAQVGFPPSPHLQPFRAAFEPPFQPPPGLIADAARRWGSEKAGGHLGGCLRVAAAVFPSGCSAQRHTQQPTGRCCSSPSADAPAHDPVGKPLQAAVALGLPPAACAWFDNSITVATPYKALSSCPQVAGMGHAEYGELWREYMNAFAECLLEMRGDETSAAGQRLVRLWDPAKP